MAEVPSRLFGKVDVLIFSYLAFPLFLDNLFDRIPVKAVRNLASL